jgi:elongation factor Ts
MTQVSAMQVKSLRDRTGAGMMDCKNALVETDGDEEKAIDIIKKKGLAKAAKKAGAIAAEGVVHAYIHPGARVGVLVEINCQTDFVARNEEFQEFVDNVGLQIASMSPEFVSGDDIAESAVADKERFFMEQLREEEAETGKKRPEAAIGKIIGGKVAKWKKEACLLDQPLVTDEEGLTVGEIQTALTGKLGEKISIRRFIRYELAEGIEKKKVDLAADVAATIANA